MALEAAVKRHRLGDAAVSVAVMMLGLVVMGCGWLLVRLQRRAARS